LYEMKQMWGGEGWMVIQGRNFMTNSICVDKIRTLDMA